MQSILLPCKAVHSSRDPQMVIWYKLTKFGQSTLSVGKHLITKDPRFSVIYYSVGSVAAPASWDLQISNVRLSDAADYQCHVQLNQTRESRRSTVKLIVQGKQRSPAAAAVDGAINIDRVSVSCVYRKRKNKRRKKQTSFLPKRTEIIRIRQ